MRSLVRRPILLLEVLIAFALVALCAIPLIYPHVAIFKEEKKFISVIELDHAVNLLFANRLEKLYLHEISCEEVETGRENPSDDLMLKESGYIGSLPYKGTYKFVEVRHKPENQSEDAVYLYKLIFEFVPKMKKEKVQPFSYEYQIVIERKPDGK